MIIAETLKKIATLVTAAVTGAKVPVAEGEAPPHLETREEIALRISGSNLPAYAKRQALAKIGYRLRKFSRSDVDAVARQVLGPDARYMEIPDPKTQTPVSHGGTGEKEHVFGVVTHPAYHRMVSRFERYAPGEGRRRMVQALTNPTKVQEMKK